MYELQELTTNRLVLEPLTPDHARDLFEPFQDKELYDYIFWETPKSVESLRDFFEQICRGKSKDGKETWLNWASRLNESSDYSGYFEASIREGDASLAYYTFKPYQKMGLAKEGVSRIISYLSQYESIHSFTLEMDTRNRASTKLAESLGFQWQKTVNNACELKGFQSHEFVFKLPVGGR